LACTIAPEPVWKGPVEMTTQRASVLLVEDEDLISEMIADALSEFGFSVYAVPDAETALSYLESGAAVDILFTDINLLGPMDGSMLAERARDRRPDLPIVYCSGHYSPSALSPPVPRSIFVKKPYNPKDLCKLFSRLTSGTAH
jgi:CheY-like chemotaxis protein